MKTFKTLLVIQLLLILVSQGHAGGIPFIIQVEKRGVKAIDIPKEYNWKSANLEYLHIGYEWEQVQIFMIPVWNVSGTYKAWVDTRGGKVLNLRPDLLQEILDKTGKSLPIRPPITFWEKYGGKAVSLPLWLIVFVIWVFIKVPDKRK